MPFPDCKKYSSGKPDDCLRVAIAKVLDEHPRNVKYFSPERNTSNLAFWEDWDKYLISKYGKHLEFWISDDHKGKWTMPPKQNIKELLNSDREWIAVVDSKEGPTESHAINMKGSKLVADFSGFRKQKPKKIRYGITLESVWRIEKIVEST